MSGTNDDDQNQPSDDQQDTSSQQPPASGIADVAKSVAESAGVPPEATNMAEKVVEDVVQPPSSHDQSGSGDDDQSA